MLVAFLFQAVAFFPWLQLLNPATDMETSFTTYSLGINKILSPPSGSGLDPCYLP